MMGHGYCDIVCYISSVLTTQGTHLVARRRKMGSDLIVHGVDMRIFIELWVVRYDDRRDGRHQLRLLRFSWV